MERKPRAIRLNDIEWASFIRLLGPDWLRRQIANAEAQDREKTIQIAERSI